jgi:hypothetical protein
MPDTMPPYQHLQTALSEEEMTSLKETCKAHITNGQTIPYALLDQLDLPVVEKIQRLVSEKLGREVHYLNDFYIYTDDTFSAGWHMDTELFAFANAVNAWILLSPESVTDPLCFIDGFNESADDVFHSVKIDNDECVFSNFSNRKQERRALAEIEQGKLRTPKISVGDILLLDPRRFHRTNTQQAKHCLVIKFVFEGEGDESLLTTTKVPAFLWPEVGIFTKMVKEAGDWSDVLDRLREELKTPDGRKALNAGFFPEKIELYREKVRAL